MAKMAFAVPRGRRKHMISGQSKLAGNQSLEAERVHKGLNGADGRLGKPSRFRSIVVLQTNIYGRQHGNTIGERVELEELRNAMA
jgi:hypothetical protein